jgi:hypothetical protein
MRLGVFELDICDVNKVCPPSNFSESIKYAVL